MGKLLSSESKAYLRLVFGTFAVLIAVAALNILIIINSLGTNIFKPIQRNIAAVAAIPEVKPKKIMAPVIEINCRNKKALDSVTTLAPNARFTFKNCKNVGRLINKSNKNQGDIFPLKKNQWTSDYVALSPGKNLITAPLGKETKTIEITRKVVKKVKQNNAL